MRVTTTFSIPPTLANALREHLRRQGAARKQSQWICEALQQLQQADPQFSRVGLGEDISRSTERSLIKTVVLSADAVSVIEAAIIAVRTDDPLQEGGRSAVIRAAIRYRLGNQPAS